MCWILYFAVTVICYEKKRKATQAGRTTTHIIAEAWEKACNQTKENARKIKGTGLGT
jgi:hypothetical protein